MFQIMKNSISQLDTAWFLALDDINARFARTILGPLWIVISNIALVGGISVVFGALFKAPIREFVVYVAIGIALWTYIQNIIVGASAYFKSGSTMLFTYDIPWSIQIVRKVMVEAIVLGIHLLVTIPVVLVALGPPSLLGAAFGVLGIIITLVFGLGLALIISSYGIRYLDLGHALESVMLFLFLFTPVFWTEASLGETRSVIVHYNPLFHFLELARAPIIKGNIPVDSLLIAVPASLLTLFVGVFIYVKRRPQIGVWMQ